MDAKLDERSLSKLRWRCRRGMVENDLFVQRFFNRYADTLTTGQAAGLLTLMDLGDNDLLDLLLGRQEPQGEIDMPEVRDVLALMKTPPAGAGGDRLFETKPKKGPLS